MLWRDLKQAVHAGKLFIVAELKQTGQNSHQCETLTSSYHKYLIAILAANGGITSY